MTMPDLSMAPLFAWVPFFPISMDSALDISGIGDEVVVE
jgi:hypothetical protein